MLNSDMMIIQLNKKGEMYIGDYQSKGYVKPTKDTDSKRNR